MKILKNKTYKKLLLKIEVLESDKVKLQKKCDDIQNEFNLSEQRSRIKFDNLNERFQKAESERDNYKTSYYKERIENDKLKKDIIELQSKLSRKGLGKKGRKKEDIIEQHINESQITEVEFEKQKYVEITSEEQLEKYDGCKFEAELFINGVDYNVNGVIKNRDGAYLFHKIDGAGWIFDKDEKEEVEYKYCWAVFDCDFGTNIKSLKVLL